tara:strand:+ start:1040 stop:1462 length:423 start_codon:yes stop_codon:yes gene_type:complete
MENTPAPLQAVVSTWSDPARAAFWACRELFHQTAVQAGTGPLDETIKWGQPAWRPVRARTGSTLRMGWSPAKPAHLSLFVDCKTDLAARMRDLYPNLAGNDGRRQMALDLTQPLPEQAVSHLAQMTFCYHRSRRKAGAVG